MRALITLLLAIVPLLYSLPAPAASSIMVNQTGNTVYTIQGNNMDGVAAIQLSISYDSTSLLSPSVIQEVSNAMLSSNATQPGTIQIAIIAAPKPLAGSGLIATIRFAERRGNGGITSASLVSLLDVPGKSLAGQAGFQNSSTLTQVSSSNTPNDPPPAVSAGPGPFPLGALEPTSSGGPIPVAPNDQTSTPPGGMNPVAPNDQTSTPPGGPIPAAETPALEQPGSTPKAPDKPVEHLKAAPRTTTAYTGILDRFKNYKGEKSPAILTALFKKDVSERIRQAPPIALSDGSTMVRLQVDVTIAGQESPNFSLNGAKMISLKRDDESGRWTIEAIPRKHAVSATLTVLTSTEIFEFPFTIAPPLDPKAFPASLDETAFKAFLKETGSDKTPKFDLNGDGRRDYLDDYIFTANYLVKQQTQKSDNTPPKPAQK